MVQAITRGQLKKLAGKPDGTRYWIEHKDEGKIKAFYGSMEKYEAIPGWEAQMPSLDHTQPRKKLDHGYDESKKELELKDLKQAALFRGGLLNGEELEGKQWDGEEWDGDMDMPLSWSCCQKHTFQMTPHSVLKGGHWCLECIAPPWNYDALAEKNLFAAQVLEHDR
jgi:hypothetical protein